MTEHVGFAGLGIMGAGMARNLIKSGFDLTVYNRTAARTEPLVAEGAGAVSTPKELAERCGVVLICVSDTPDVEEMLFGADGIAAGLADGGLVVDTSTVNPESTQAWAQRLAGQGVGFVDAPVSGGSEGAEQGTLSIMVGGTSDHVERARPYLEAMGSAITHVGDVGAGQTCKLVNQILVVVNMLGVAEALVFAKAGGLDLEKTIAAVEGGAAGSWMLSKRGPQVINRDWRPGFRTDLQQKDLRLVLEAAESFQIPTIATGMVSNLYRTLLRDDLGHEGNHALVKALEQLTGVTASQESAG